MRSSLRYMPILAGALALAGWVGTAEAQTPLNIGGSSAAKNFMGDIPLDLCDAAPLPNKFTNVSGSQISWSCNRVGSPIVIRYSATNSADGVNKIVAASGSAGSLMTYQDETNLVGCTGPVLTTRPSDAKQYNAYTGCTATVSLTTHMGAADVQGSSFHQSGPFGTTVNPLPDSSLNSQAVVVVPFSIYVGKAVVNVDRTLGTPAGPIKGLSRYEIEAILSGAITDWRQLGYGTVTGGVLDLTSPITVCHRIAGSGTKAALAATVLITSNEYSLFANAGHHFVANTGDMVKCLTDVTFEPNATRAIGYADADQLDLFVSTGTKAGLAYPVAIEGTLAYDWAVSDPKIDLKCGRYPFWASERLNRRVGGEGAAIDALATAFITDAGFQATIGIIPTGKYWASDEEMSILKNQDRGPIIWKAGNHPECRQFPPHGIVPLP